MWKEISHNNFKAEKNGESLEDLAIQVGSKAASWSCIWVVGDWKDPSTYAKHQASCGDVADVSNLVTNTKNEFKYLITTEPDIKKGLKSAFGNIPYKRADLIPDALKEASGEGATPISYFLLAGHGYGALTGGMAGTEDGKHMNYVTWDNIAALDTPASYQRAQKKKGPCLCWFTWDAKVRLAGCRTNTMASNFAKFMLRDSAVSYGTRFYTGWSGGEVFWSYPDNINLKPTPNYEALHMPWETAPVWDTYNAQN